MRKFSIGVLLLAAALLAASSGADEKATASRLDSAACFYGRDFRTWRPAADAKSMVILVGQKRYIRVEFAGSCPELRWPTARLITIFRGTDSVCNALDWDLHVSQGPPAPMPVPCIVRHMVELSPEQVAALPKQEKP
jgi:hypothetical protein